MLLFVILQALSLRAAVHTVQVADFSFTPANVNAVCGDTVLWIWVGGTHTTTSTTIPACAASWDAPINSSVGMFMYVIPCAGNYSYVCTVHPGMTGTITATCVTGIDEKPLATVQTYPNPFQRQFVVWPGHNDVIRISDLLGKVVRTIAVPKGQEVLLVDLAVPAGLYLVQFYSAGVLTETRKLVRQ